MLALTQKDSEFLLNNMNVGLIFYIILVLLPSK